MNKLSWATRLEVKTCAACAGSYLDARHCAVRVDLLEHVDCTRAGRVDAPLLWIKPDVVNAKDAGKRGNDPAGLRIHHDQPSGLKRGRKQSMIVSSNASAWTFV